ncbi:formate/nitrite transporter family protein [Maledivibacter halophilus]|uniref:Formate/nitrite transporter n=1 Tax=Maledivibacter halophilus TaxID=36842 RepID=A0A1T5MBQ1_9FIRM|nr:formate/nitrite transporter family protein [Maledivibacter halophilus]SKC85666.1 formate/nitrite transporter [Maledivibacter halophilus]
MGKRMLTPLEIANATVVIGVKKAKLASLQMLLLGIFAGMFIGFGAHADITVMQTIGKFDIGFAKFFGAAVFPVGLMLVLMVGAELFTGNNLMTLGLLDRKITVKQMLKNWGLVYIGNFVGSIVLAWLLRKSGLYISQDMTAKAIEIAEAKMSLTFVEAFIRAILCNMLVVLSVLLATASKDVIGKIFAIWFPIMLFVLSGFEHSIANMFFIPLGKLVGFNTLWTTIWIKNLIPVTLGNIVGGAIIVPVVYYLCYILPYSKENIENQEIKSVSLQ